MEPGRPAPEPTGVLTDHFGSWSVWSNEALCVSSPGEGGGVVRLYRRQSGSWAVSETLQAPLGYSSFGLSMMSAGEYLGVYMRGASITDNHVAVYQVHSAGPATLLDIISVGGAIPFPYISPGFVLSDSPSGPWIAWSTAHTQGSLWARAVQPAGSPPFLQVESVAYPVPAEGGVLVPLEFTTSGNEWQYFRIRPSATGAIAGERFTVPVNLWGVRNQILAGGVAVQPEFWSMAMGVSACESVPSASGRLGSLSGRGCASASQGDLSLELSELAPNGVGILVESLGPPSPLPGAGPLCVSAPYSRLAIYQADASGTATVPNAQIGAFAAGQTRTFIGWYRDGTSALLTNSLALTATP